MTSVNCADEVLKQDERGRVRLSRERREALLVEFDRSGLSATRFARLAGLNYQTFMGWVRRRRLNGARAVQGTEQHSGPVHFLEAVLSPSGGGRAMMAGGLEVELPGGSRVKIQAPDQLALAAELIRMVAQAERTRC